MSQAASYFDSDEWLSFVSIYPDFTTGSAWRPDVGESSIKLDIPVEFSSPRTINIYDDSHGSNTKLTLSTLPSLLLSIVLPADYPDSRPPIISSLFSTWLTPSQTSALSKKLLSRWNPGEGVLCTWVEVINSGEFLRDIDYLETVQIPHPAPQLLCRLLTAHAKNVESNKFSMSSYGCAICLGTYKGSKCLELECGHIFCRNCLEDFWKLCIKEGDVERVGCPDSDCIKAKRLVNEEELAQVVNYEEVQRWRWLKEKLAIEREPGICICPMSFCGRIVPRPPDVGDGDNGWDRLRTCAYCGYSFCAFCSRTWHGPVMNCPISMSETWVREYLTADDNGKRLMEIRFGRKNMLRLVANYEEARLNTELLKSSTQPCPGCNIRVEKSLGCNHMTCRCGMHFCFRCGSRINSKDPYVHFSTPGSECNGQLFENGATDALGI
ncbi:RWD-domain-containing protein, partial [Mycena floridula]